VHDQHGLLSRHFPRANLAEHSLVLLAHLHFNRPRLHPALHPRNRLGGRHQRERQLQEQPGGFPVEGLKGEDFESIGDGYDFGERALIRGMFAMRASRAPVGEGQGRCFGAFSCFLGGFVVLVNFDGVFLHHYVSIIEAHNQESPYL
jgi:hypothetical protein